MTSRPELLAARRERLVARSRAQRAEFGIAAGRLRGEIAVAEILIGAVRRARRSGPWIGALAAVLMVVGPAKIARGVSAAVRFAPYAIDAYRLVKGKRGLAPFRATAADHDP